MRFSTFCLTALLLVGLADRLLALGEEDFGNSKVVAQNYTDWPGLAAMLDNQHRVYHYWVNGNEGFFFNGDVKALNASLKQFAEVKSKTKRLVLLGGKGLQSSFHGKKVAYSWRLQIVGGIAKGFAERHNDPQIYHFEPTVYAYCDQDFDLSKLEIPENITVEDVRDLRQRYYRGIEKGDRQVAGYAAYYLADVDLYNQQSAAKIASILKKDDNSWAVRMACSALAKIDAAGESELAQLQAAKAKDEPARKAIAEAIEKITKNKRDKAAVDALAKANQRIAAYVARLKKR